MVQLLAFLPYNLATTRGVTERCPPPPEHQIRARESRSDVTPSGPVNGDSREIPLSWTGA